jgi:hypothetical protein
MASDGSPRARVPADRSAGSPDSARSPIDLVDRVLLAVLTDPIEADTMEIGFDVLSGRLGADSPRAALAAAIEDGVRRGLLHDPVRLAQGALHCHWHLEPTRRGKALAISPSDK